MYYDVLNFDICVQPLCGMIILCTFRNQLDKEMTMFNIFCVYFNKFCRLFSDKFILAGAIMTYWRRLLFEKKNTQQNNNQSHTKTQMDYKSCTHTLFHETSNTADFECKTPQIYSLILSISSNNWHFLLFQQLFRWQMSGQDLLVGQALEEDSWST